MVFIIESVEGQNPGAMQSLLHNASRAAFLPPGLPIPPGLTMPPGPPMPPGLTMPPGPPMLPGPPIPPTAPPRPPTLPVKAKIKINRLAKK